MPNQLSEKGIAVGVSIDTKPEHLAWEAGYHDGVPAVIEHLTGGLTITITSKEFRSIEDVRRFITCQQ